MRALMITAAAALGLSACGYVSEYESHVHDMEPVYCYRTLGAIQCQATPDREADRRLVNYYGPDPSRTERAEKPPAVLPDPPPEVNYWVKDAEPIPRPAPLGDLSDRPWLLGETKAAPAEKEAQKIVLVPVVLQTPTQSF